MEEDKSFSELMNHVEDNNHGWQKVVNHKKQRKNQNKKTAPDSSKLPNGSAIPTETVSVFTSLEKHADERRRNLEAQRSAMVFDDEDEIQARLKQNRRRDEDDDDSSSDSDVKNYVTVVNRKEKQKKAKKPKVTLAEAAAKIGADSLAVFLSGVSESYEGQQDIQLMRFADYFGRAFSAVNASQFPWLKLFRESSVAKIADVPISYISEAVYTTSVDWINHRSYEALGDFVVWSLDSILANLASQQQVSKGSKKGGQPASSKSQVAIFIVLAMVLRRKPDVLINILSKLSDSKYQAQDKLPVIIWMIVQTCQGDLAVGLYLWAHHILPVLGGKSGSNPHTRDLVLQLVERILGAPKARSILVSNAVRKGERLVPPAALNLLLHATFPTPSARVKATERFEAIYPLLKDISLAGSTGSKAMKQVSLQIQTSCVEAAREGNPALSVECTSIFLWCLTQNPDCYRQWDKIYMDNIESSIAILKKLAENWKELSSKQSSLQALEETLKSFRQKNEKALSDGVDASHQALFKDADKYSKALLGRVSGGHGCAKAVVVTLAVLAVGAAFVSPYLNALDWDKLSDLFNAYQH